MPLSLAALGESLKQLTTADEKLSVLNRYIEDINKPPPTFQLQANSGTPSQSYYTDLAGISEGISSLIVEHGLSDGILKLHTLTLKKGTQYPPPLNCLGCGNFHVYKKRFCENDGTKFCSGCRLVKYCSKACQSEHWKVHKSCCKSPENSKTWRTRWEKEGRDPAFLGAPRMQTPFGMGVILWGNVPAIDLLALKTNEGQFSKDRDFALAFVASGDLRNVIHTVNGLPEDYKGTLSMVINDFNPQIVCRNYLVLMILGLIEDIEEGSEHALHVWYSLFLPESYTMRIAATVLRSEVFNNLDETRSSMTKTTSVYRTFNPSTIGFLSMWLSLTLTPSDASNAYNAVMNNPERADYQDRFFSTLKPSHRVAYDTYRSFGLVMPFGAPNAHMNRPNGWLFSPDKRLCMNDSANPLEGWNPKLVFESGKAHGTSEEDILGCLFFHVKDQLIEFAKRLRKFKINIFLSDVDAISLPKILTRVADCPPVFDRIEVSNIVDRNYVGVPRVLSTFGPLLNPKNKSAAIVGLFMNWIEDMPSGSVTKAQVGSPSAMGEAMNNMSKQLPQAVTLSRGKNDPKMFEFVSGFDAFYNNAPAFRAFLKQAGEPAAAKAARLRLRSVNKIVPPRMNVPLGSSFDAIVDVHNMDDWYNIRLTGTQHTERYCEWTK